MRYLDPKADLTFKKVFGQHKDLTISLINALLPLPEGGEVTDIEYLTPELMPETPMGRNSIVDVRCRDAQGRQFLVEMQTVWSQAFMARVLFNSSKAFVRQIEGGAGYQLLQPVYSLNLVNAVFMPDLPDEFIHNYNIVHELHSDKIIEGLHLTFVELKKFKPQSIAERKMAVLWLRFLTEITPDIDEAPEDLLDNELTSKALDEVKKSAFSESQLYTYEKFWDAVSVEKTLLYDAETKGQARGMERGMAQGLKKGMEQGLKQGLEKGLQQGLKQGIERGIERGIEKGLKQGIEQGKEQGREEGVKSVALQMIAQGLPTPTIAICTGLTEAEIEKLR